MQDWYFRFTLRGQPCESGTSEWNMASCYKFSSARNVSTKSISFLLVRNLLQNLGLELLWCAVKPGPVAESHCQT